MHDSLSTPVLIAGGGTGGVAAALAVACGGQRCIVTEPTAWVGGQLTSQAVPPDENDWIEGKDGVQSATTSYLEFRQRCRDWMKTHRRLTPEAMADPALNPGNGWVSRLCVEPRVAHHVLLDMLAPHVESGRITVLLHHEPVSAEVRDDVVRSVTVRALKTGVHTVITADVFIDATELGDLLPMTGTAYAVGAEHRDVHGELHSRTDLPNGQDHDPLDQQAISWCFAMEHHPGEDHTIPEPAGYAAWREYRPDFDEPWPGPLFSWVVCGEHNEPRTIAMVPSPDDPKDGEWELWRYRRIVDRSIHEDTDDHPAPADVCLVNWVQMDYFLKPTLDVTPEALDAALAEAKQQSLCFFYWMQTEAPRHDDPRNASPDQAVRGYPGLKLAGETLGTDDGFAMAPYIRESRRLIAQTIVTEAQVGAQQRRAAGHPDVPELGLPAAHVFPDSVGIGHYRLDLHPTAANRNSLYVEAAPFQIPLGSLIPVKTKNLLAGAKNLGVTHITNGCYRLHPVEWNIGEAAGALAAWCLDHHQTPAAIHADPDQLGDFQAHLTESGFALGWPWSSKAEK
ncbi:MAG: FAD-dependent oxidoreductase [Planctomycetota bacterium]